jgi:ribonuclease HI
MPGVTRRLIEHSLNVDPKATPKRQHLRRFADERRDAIKKELTKLLTAGFIREVFYPEWLANPIFVRKKNTNEWRMCVDYTDLNKHCPKDPFGLPRIDQVIDSTAGCDLLCFLDCYSGYHQIAIKEKDQEKTAFITPFGAGARVLLISPQGEQLKYVLQIFWKVSNNEAKYEALLHGLRLAISLGIKRLLVYDDSAVVINQVNKSWDRNKENMDTYCLEVRKIENKFYGLEFHHVVRDNNVATDVLSKLGSTHAEVPAGVFIHELHAPSIPKPAPTTTDPTPPQTGQEVMMIDVDWRQHFIDYIREQKVPTDKNLAEQIIRRAKSYVLVGDKLYRRGATSGVLMKYVPREEGKDILEEIHKGVCGNHASSRTLVSKAFRRAFYWPTALGDAEELIRRCQGCQYFAKQQHVLAYKLVTIPPTWPFACWGLDLIGPLPTAPGGFNRVLVAIDKFTKWIEVKPVTCPKANRVLNFLDELMHPYGLPHLIITDLGSNFNNHQFWEYCENSGIDVRYVSVAHPRANGQVERANGMVLDALKKRLRDAANNKGGKWIKELPNALWGLRTQPVKLTGQSPYFLVYGSKAILPANVMWDSPAVEQYDEGISEDSRRIDIDGLEEARCAALVQSARYLEGIRHYHDRNVKERSFNIGDLVLRRIQNTEGLHKLSSPWEGPFTVAKLTGPGSYRLQTLVELVERRPALSVLRVVSRLLRGSSLHDYSRILRCKRPPGPGTSL